MIGLMAGTGVFLLIAGVRRRPLVDRVGPYLLQESPRTRPVRGPVARGRVLAVFLGAAVGGVLVPSSWPGGAVIGALGGLLVESTQAHRRRVRLRRRMGFELPAVADLLALFLLAGESVLGSIRQVCAETSGVTAGEFSEVLASIEAGSGLVEALQVSAASSAHPDGSRLFRLLAEAHRSGARLVDALEIFAADRRSALDRDMVEEGGRRALTGYGPILGLMIPTTLVFLIYPTVAGLNALAGSP